MTLAPAPARRSLGKQVADWIQKYCVYPSGPQIGQPFRLMDWQREFLDGLYECDEDGNLKHRWALLGVPKGNGKSPLVACDALFHLLGDPYEPDPWVVCSAASDKQADIVFGAAKTICELSPPLREATERYRWEIRPKGAPGKMERVAASQGRLDGKLISKLIMDELHEWSLENWIVLQGGARKRQRSQVVQTTTAGFDKESVCYREYEKCQRGSADNYLFRWFGAPDGADHRDTRVWRDSNPSMDVIITEDMLADAVANIPESQFRRYHLNQWVEAEEIWLPAGAWDACKVEPFELEPGLPTFVGWDASTKHDSTAVIAAQVKGGRVYVKAKIWERPLDPNNNPVEDWAIPGAEVENYVRELWRLFKAREIAYDPAFITWKAQELATEGAPMLEFPQSDIRMMTATQTTYEAIKDKIIAHDGDPVLTRHIRSAMAVQTARGGQRLTKGKQRRIHNMIDGAVALTMAADRAMRIVQVPDVLPIGNEVREDDKRPEFSGIRGQGF